VLLINIFYKTIVKKRFRFFWYCLCKGNSKLD